MLRRGPTAPRRRRRYSPAAPRAPPPTSRERTHGPVLHLPEPALPLRPPALRLRLPPFHLLADVLLEALALVRPLALDRLGLRAREAPELLRARAGVVAERAEHGALRRGRGRERVGAAEAERDVPAARAHEAAVDVVVGSRGEGLVRERGGGGGEVGGRRAEEDGLPVGGAEGARARSERGEEGDGVAAACVEDDGAVERGGKEEENVAWGTDMSVRRCGRNSENIPFALSMCRSALRPKCTSCCYVMSKVTKTACMRRCTNQIRLYAPLLARDVYVCWCSSTQRLMSDKGGCDDRKVDADSTLLCPESGIDVQWEEALSPDLLAFAEHFLRHRKRR